MVHDSAPMTDKLFAPPPKKESKPPDSDNSQPTPKKKRDRFYRDIVKYGDEKRITLKPDTNKRPDPPVARKLLHPTRPAPEEGAMVDPIHKFPRRLTNVLFGVAAITMIGLIPSPLPVIETYLGADSFNGTLNGRSVQILSNIRVSLARIYDFELG